MNKVLKRLLIFPVGFGIILTKQYFDCKAEFQKEISFTIGKVKVTPTRRFVFYDRKGEYYAFSNFTIMAYEGVMADDSIHKGRCAEILTVFRKDGKGNFKPFLEVHPTGMIPIEWVCN